MLLGTAHLVVSAAPSPARRTRLAGTVRDYADGFAERSGIRTDLELPADLGPLSKDVATALFRTMQESLTNLHRHSGSRTASICIARHEDAISLQVRDTGHGIPKAKMASPDGPIVGLGVGIAGCANGCGS